MFLEGSNNSLSGDVATGCDGGVAKQHGTPQPVPALPSSSQAMNSNLDVSVHVLLTVINLIRGGVNLSVINYVNSVY